MGDARRAPGPRRERIDRLDSARRRGRAPHPRGRLHCALVDACSVAVTDDGNVVGAVVVQPSDLGAWLDVLAVAPEHRRRGIGAALLARTLARVDELGIAFLNAAGVRSDTAYLATLTALGARIEPDWIAFERRID